MDWGGEDSTNEQLDRVSPKRAALTVAFYGCLFLAVLGFAALLEFYHA